MANKKITDLQLISSVSDGLSIPTDNGTQTYRYTAAQFMTYIYAKLHALTAVTPQGVDHIPILDASDSNNPKKVLISKIKNAVWRSVTTTDSVGADDETMALSDASFTSTLPAIGNVGKRYKFLHKGTSLTHVYTLASTGAVAIGSYASGALKLHANGEMIEVEDNGTTWDVVGRIATTKWETWNPTEAGVGTCTSRSYLWRKNGEMFEGIGSCVLGTVTAAPATWTMPGSIVSHSDYSSTLNDVCGQIGSAGGSTQMSALVSQSSNLIGVTYQGANNLTKQNGSAAFASTVKTSLKVHVRISDWCN